MSLPAFTPPTTTSQLTQLSHPPPKPSSPPPQPNSPTLPKTTAKPRIITKRATKPINPTVAWTSSISLHCRAGNLAHAAAEFTRMRLAGVEPNHITFLTLLSGCAHFPSESVRFGSTIHAYTRKIGLDRTDVMVGTAIVDMYSKCGSAELARKVFDEMDVRNSVSWNTMIDGYMRSGQIEDAIELFDEMPKRDAISWTALINGFVRINNFEQALELFREMQLSGVEPDYVAVIAVLAACANVGTLGLGLWLNRFIMRQDFKYNIRVNNSLIDMYSRCGCSDYARQIFEKMLNRTLVSWNSMIVGFAVNGHADEALEFFDMMQKEGFEPDGVSFTGALTACSHAGLVDEGLRHFDIMKRVHRIKPRIEHYGCIVDLYSRAGRLEDAMNVIKNMPMKPNEVVLGSLLAACRTHGDVSVAEKVMNYLDELDPGLDSNYVLLANIYAAVGKWDGAGKVRRTMKELGIQKKPGISSIEIDCGIHEFVAGDQSHVHTDCIYAMLELLSLELELYGYIPETKARGSYEND